MGSEEGNGWIDWFGGECPVDPNAMIEIKVVHDTSEKAKTLFARRAWANDWNNPALVAYRLAKDTPNG